MLHSHKKGNALVDLIIAMIIMGLVSISVVGAYTSLMSMASNSFRNSQASWFGNSVMEIYSAKAFGDIIADNNFTLNDQFPGYTADITVEPKDVDLSTSTFAAGGGDSKYKEITVTAFNNVSSNSFTLKTIIRDPAVDRDGDGVNDSEDACPDDPNESVDTDGDGVCDNSDAYPVDPTRTGGAIYTFTNCEKEGQSGPSQEQCNSEYGEGVVTVTVDNGIQEWTVPTNGTYSIEAWGAAGGTQLYQDDYPGGDGAKIIGSFTLTQDDVLKILVGQKGENTRINYENNAAPGGGGGSFVWKSASEETLLIAAGGGGGGGRGDNGTNTNANTGKNGHRSLTNDNGGISGNGGRPNTGGSSYWAGGGAGWITDGTGGNKAAAYIYTPFGNGARGGRRPLNGGLGGTRYNDGNDEGGDGGFGGGGGGGSDNMGTGGGGGYSGGGGSSLFAVSYLTDSNAEGGGGGSYCGDQDDGECIQEVNATGEENEWEPNEGHGKVIITTGTIGEGSGSSWVVYSNVVFQPNFLERANIKRSHQVNNGDTSSGITQCLAIPGCVGFTKGGGNINSSGLIYLRSPLTAGTSVNWPKLKNGDVPLRKQVGWFEVIYGMTCDNGIDLTKEEDGGPQPNDLETTCTNWPE